MPTSDPASLNISNYYTAPLGARRILEAILPPAHDCTDLSADPIYLHHPSAREDLQHPLLLHPAAPTLNSTIIDDYYITGIYSTSIQNDNIFYNYIYLPNDYDYDHTTDVIDIITIQLDSMQTAGYPTSPSGIHAASDTSISDDPPTADLDDDPFDTTTLYTPPQLITYPYKFRLSLPANSPSTAGMLLLANRQAPWTTEIPKK